MGKKRISSSILTKNYAGASTRSKPTGSSSPSSSLSVSQKLSKLRLEEIQHERNNAGPGAAPNRPSPVVVGMPGQVDPEIAHMLGQIHIEPQPRVKPRNRGHLAPKSWSRTQQFSQSREGIQSRLRHYTGHRTLVDICLDYILENIDQFHRCGLNYAAGHIKTHILASLNGEIAKQMWFDIVPEESDDIFEIDISYASPPILCLKRLVSLNKAIISFAQVESPLLFSLPTVLQELSIRGSLATSAILSIQKARWRKLSTYFVAIRSLYLDLSLNTIDSAAEVQQVEDLLNGLAEGPDWTHTLDTLKLIHITLPKQLEVGFRTSITTLCYALSKSVRARRRRGFHIEVSIS